MNLRQMYVLGFECFHSQPNQFAPITTFPSILSFPNPQSPMTGDQ
jgi:hypothetical protein